jgi:hypothetical protein
MRIAPAVFGLWIVLLLLGAGLVDAQQFFEIHPTRTRYEVGDDVALCISVSEPATIYITLYGPYGSLEIEPLTFGPGSGCFSIGSADPRDVGHWQVVGRACVEAPPPPPPPLASPPLRIGLGPSAISVNDLPPQCFGGETEFWVGPEQVVTVTHGRTVTQAETVHATYTITVRSTSTLAEYVTQTVTETQPIVTTITRIYYVVIVIVVFVPWYFVKRKKAGPQ